LLTVTEYGLLSSIRTIFLSLFSDWAAPPLLIRLHVMVPNYVIMYKDNFFNDDIQYVLLIVTLDFI
jgi:hypothetical protein